MNDLKQKDQMSEKSGKSKGKEMSQSSGKKQKKSQQINNNF